ncbi:MAG: hypothetical protein NZT61_02760 [Deltaproteobacteria bacterium]|nr:hypothetical protein [Deltaproteobacteria bacterium]MCX7952705.1 hypothetical protein [Deltaproteobacteria bacterium]
MECKIVGESSFCHELNSILSQFPERSTLFYLHGEKFTGKNYFAQLFCAKHGLVPISIKPQSNLDDLYYRELQEEIKRVFEKGTIVCLILEDCDTQFKLVRDALAMLRQQLTKSVVFNISTQFRSDILKLFDLNSINYKEIHFPPLRDRKQDIVPLLEHLYQLNHKQSLQIQEEAKRALMLYNWPDNILEVNRLILEHSQGVMTIYTLPEKFFITKIECDFSPSFTVSDTSLFLWQARLKKLTRGGLSTEAIAQHLDLSPRALRFLKILTKL